MVPCKDDQHERNGDPWGRPGFWWGGGLVMDTHLHLGNSGWSLSIRKVAVADLVIMLALPAVQKLPALEIMTAVFPLCSLMQCMC